MRSVLEEGRISIGNIRLWPWFTSTMYVIAFTVWLLEPFVHSSERPVEQKIRKQPEHKLIETRLVQPPRGTPPKPNPVLIYNPSPKKMPLVEEGLNTSSPGPKIVIQEGPEEDLRAAIERYGGDLCFGDPGDITYCEFKFHSPDWSRVEPERSLFSLGGRCYGCLIELKRGKWTFVESTAITSSLPANLRAYILMPFTYGQNLSVAIQNELAADGLATTDTAKEIQVTFDARADTGFTIHILQ